MLSMASLLCMITSSLINYFFDKENKPAPKWLVAIYAVVITGLNLSVAKSGADMLTVLAGLVFVMSIIQKNGKMFRLYTIVNLTLWCTYDFFKLSYRPLVQHTIQLLFIILGILIHVRRKKEC